MNLGCFSVSLNVKDIAASYQFYSALGFTPIEGAGSVEDKWIVMNNGEANIGLFEGMLEANVLTFNPQDARAIQQHLKQQNINLIREADESGTGPDYVIMKDPDGNQIMLDQHV